MTINHEHARQFATKRIYWTSAEVTARNYGELVLALLLELEQAKRERDEARNEIRIRDALTTQQT